MSSRFNNPLINALKAGVSLPRAQMDFWVNGTTTKQDTFSDEALTLVNLNPVIANDDGRFGDIYLQALNYTIRLQDEDGNDIWTVNHDARVPFEISASLQGVPGSLQKILPAFVFTRSVSFLINFMPSRAQGLTNATAQTDFDIRRGNLGGASSSIGTMRFAAATKVATFIVAAAQTFVAGDYLEVVSPASVDATLADVSMTLVGNVV